MLPGLSSLGPLEAYHTKSKEQNKNTHETHMHKRKQRTASIVLVWYGRDTGMKQTRTLDTKGIKARTKRGGPTDGRGQSGRGAAVQLSPNQPYKAGNRIF